MKFQFLTPTIALVGLSAITVSATGGWFTSCFSPMTIPDGSYFLLLAYCPGGYFPETMDSINLDACFSNDNGKLVPRTTTTEYISLSSTLKKKRERSRTKQNM